MPLVSVPGAGPATVSHHHGSTHQIQQQVNQHHHVIHHENIATASPQQQQQFADPHSLNDSNNTGVPIIPVVSAAPLAPEKVSPVTFQPNQPLPPATVSVSTCPPVR